MADFKKRILSEEGFYPEFIFYRIFTAKGIGFHISVIDKNRQSQFFNMEQTAEGWRIVNAPKLPDWIINIEKKLSDAIDENMAD
jgi:hypothetical protein